MEKTHLGGRRLDEYSVREFDKHSDERLRMTKSALKRGTFTFSPLKPVAIPKKNSSKYRPLLIPTVEDRVVQRAILHVLGGQIKSHVTRACSHAFRQGLGVSTAVSQVKQAVHAGHNVLLIADIENFFGSIDTERLFSELEAVLRDDSLSELLRQLQKWEIRDLASLPLQKRRCFPDAGKGVPQGSALSPLLSNFYLRELDREVEARGWNAVRYADDIAVACHSESQARDAHAWLQTRLADLGLRVPDLGHPKVKIADLSSDGKGVEYLGYFLHRRDGKVLLKPTDAALKHALNEIDDCFAADSQASLSERYARLSFFVTSWLSTYRQGHLCDLSREAERLTHRADRGMRELLIARKLLPRDGELTREIREFLGIGALLEKSRHNKAVA